MLASTARFTFIEINYHARQMQKKKKTTKKRNNFTSSGAKKKVTH